MAKRNSLQDTKKEMWESRIHDLEAELAEARRDGARARWYFDRKNASKVVEIELRCIQADDWWDYERWAREIDAVMEAK